MKINKYKFQISDIKEIHLLKNSFPLLNFYSYIRLINYIDFRINKEYLKLLPIKINRLKDLKNTLLKIQYLYKNNSKTLYKQEYLKLKNDFPKEYKMLMKLLNKNNNEQNIKKYNRLINYIDGIKYSIKYIESQINKYQKDLNNKNRYIEYRINSFDIESIENKRTTENLKRVFYYYMIALKKIKISERTKNYFNSIYIANIINQYSEYNNIKEDFDKIIEPSILKFKNFFLYKTI